MLKDLQSESLENNPWLAQKFEHYLMIRICFELKYLHVWNYINKGIRGVVCCIWDRK